MHLGQSTLHTLHNNNQQGNIDHLHCNNSIGHLQCNNSYCNMLGHLIALALVFVLLIELVGLVVTGLVVVVVVVILVEEASVQVV